MSVYVSRLRGQVLERSAFFLISPCQARSLQVREMAIYRDDGREVEVITETEAYAILLGLEDGSLRLMRNWRRGLGEIGPGMVVLRECWIKCNWWDEFEEAV